METLKNITDSPKSSFKALLLSLFTTAGTIAAGAIGSGINEAAKTYTATGNVTDWKPYAAAAIVGVGTFLGSGALRKDSEPAKAAPLPPALQPVVNVASQVGLQYLSAAAVNKLQPSDPDLANAVQQALSAHLAEG